jgi:hypothetical protein
MSVENVNEKGRTVSVGSVSTGSEAPRAGSDYEARLAEWKARAGYREPLEESDEADAALVAADRKLPGEDYCVLCGEGPQPISSLVLITHRCDPYIQMDQSGEDEEDMIDARLRACPRCYKENYEDEDEAPEPPNGEISHAEKKT